MTQDDFSPSIRRMRVPNPGCQPRGIALLNFAYSFDEEGDPRLNNGSLQTLVDRIDQTTTKFEYNDRDELKRVVRDGEGGYSQTFGIDLYGNMTRGDLSFDARTNRIDSPDFLYDAQGNLYEDRSRGQRYLWNGAGRLVEVMAHGGNGLTLGYDATGFLMTVTDTRRRQIRFTKGPNGKVQTITEPDGDVHRYEYDSDGNLLTFTDAACNTVRYAYDDLHNLVGITDADGQSWQMGYDERGRLAWYSEPADDEGDAGWQVEYQPSEAKTLKRDAEGNTFTYWYNENGNITYIRDPQREDTEITYNERFLPVTVIAAAGPDLEVVRTYNSQDMRSGMFGHGWSFTYSIRLLETTEVPKSSAEAIVRFGKVGVDF